METTQEHRTVEHEMPQLPTLGELAYNLFFVLVLPILLILWAHYAAPTIQLPGVRAPWAGWTALVLGHLLMLSGIGSLVIFGKGLPSNLSPPRQLVVQGPYRFLAHPIYIGFSLAVLGVALLARSGAGLWLVAPTVMIGCTSLVLGYERIDLRRRFGDDLPVPVLSIPPPQAGPPSTADRVAVCLLVLLPWVALYFLLAAAGTPPHPLQLLLPGEERLPVWEWTELLYALTYPFVVGAVLAAPTRIGLRRFALRGIAATLGMPLFFFAFPIVAIPRSFAPSTLLGELLAFERTLDTPGNAFPSYHVIWSFLAAEVFASRWPRLRVIWWLAAAAVAVSCVTTGMHTVADVAAGLLIAAGLRNMERIWAWLRTGAERIANSWKEWRFGSVRVINHGAYAGVGAFLAVAIVDFALGTGAWPAVLFVASVSLATAALWAQVVEGSPSLLRPFGYYGGVLGVVIGSLLAGPIFQIDPWLLLASYSLAGPWVQSFGRIRCLVQGCCHGREAPAWLGIVYNHPRSRVCRLSDLKGTPVHPAPLYSILWNVVIVLLVTPLWFREAPLSLLAGLYLILTGLGRFAEEAYRGEPQTKMLGGLRLYQWIALVTIAAGAVMTCIPSARASALMTVSWQAVGMALGFGLVTWFALGVDFPSSNRRFARLA